MDTVDVMHTDVNIVVKIGELSFAVDLAGRVSLARPLDFASAPISFGAQPPSRIPVQIGDFIGDTRQGGGCNVDQLTIVPHCHGTHTETVGHIVDEEVTIASANLPGWMVATLLTVSVESAEQSSERYQPTPLPGDVLMTAQGLAVAWQQLLQRAGGGLVTAYSECFEKALIVRCAESNRPAPASVPPYFSTNAIQWCNENGVRHLLLESPSIDRLEDDGRLTNHHAYWNVPAGTHSLTADSWNEKTITESIVIDKQVPDGVYLLNLQVPSFGSDAAPSNPVICPLVPLDDSKSESAL